MALKFLGRDRRQLLDILIQAVEITSAEGNPPAIEVDGAPHDLLKVAALLPDEPLQPDHQDKVNKLFKRRQHGYQRTGYNLAHRALAIAANNRSMVALRSLHQGASHIQEASSFAHRGLSKRTVEALVAYGIDTPERLLFMTEASLMSIPGIGKASLSEIKRYRARVLPERP
jgi:hypothetical protein